MVIRRILPRCFSMVQFFACSLTIELHRFSEVGYGYTFGAKHGELVV